MPQQKVTLQSTGLRTSPNPLTVGQGGLSKASNVIIRRDNIVEQRRGFKVYGTGMTSQAKQLLEYKGTLLRHFEDTLQYDTQELNTSDVYEFNTFAGNFSEVDAGLRIKSIESNGNFYFTTSDGIKKISATNASDFTEDAGYIIDAGGVKATNGSARIALELGEITGFLPEDSAVAYRLVWGIRDVNNNTILGTPSERILIYNPLMGFLIPDYMRVLGVLDNITNTATTAFISDDNYVSTLSLTQDATPVDLQTNLLALAEKIDDDILYATADSTAPLNMDMCSIDSASLATITFSSGDATQYFDVGSEIEINGFTSTSPLKTQFNNIFVVSSVVSSQITFLVPSASESISSTSVDATAQIVSNEFRNSMTEVVYQGSNFNLNTYDLSSPVNNNDLKILQAAIEQIIVLLQTVPDTVVSALDKTTYVDELQITTTTNVILNINIPDAVTSSHFLQIYRSNTAQATGTTVLSDLVPDDEMQQVYEAFPTATELAAHRMIVEDILIDDFKGANLYTNPSSGEGILQANDVPPIAKDINQFRNSIYYANTRTRQRLNLNLLGIQNFKAGEIDGIISGSSVEVTTGEPHDLSTNDLVYINGTGIVGLDEQIFPATVINTSAFTVPFTSASSSSVGYWTNAMVSVVKDSSASNYFFIQSQAQQATISTIADVADSLNGDYFTISSANDNYNYYVWYKTSGGALTDPAPTGYTGIQVNVATGASANAVAEATRDALRLYPQNFIVSGATNQIIVLNYEEGRSTIPAAQTSGFTIAIGQYGRGEYTVKNEVGLSNNISPAIAVDETARSFQNVVNSNTSETVYIYYLSGLNDTPGKMLVEGRQLSSEQFYILANNDEVGTSFDPAITPNPNNRITNTASTPTVITASVHNLVSGDDVVIAFSNSGPNINGVHTVTFLTSTTFSIAESVSVAGTSGVMIKAKLAISSNDEAKKNRIYYSKVQQPEAVPIVNYLDVGSSEKNILRIFPLRDSLFVFKEDGLYRLSGETLPVSVALFDSSCILVAPDSIGIANNIIYGWTTQGIHSVTESGAETISRDIDNIILPVASAEYPNFRTVTWGVGYDSDNSYTVYTNTAPTDEYASIAYRYSNLTQSWTTVDKETTCGIILSSDDKFYMGAGDINNIEQERKTFSRFDYADREYNLNLGENGYFDEGASLYIAASDDLSEGDVLVQEQYVTVYNYNALLKKLDNDSGVAQVAITSISTSAVPTITTTYFDFPSASVNTTTNIITVNNNGFVANQKIKFATTGTLPSPLNSTSTYRVINPSTNGFSVADDFNGASIDITTQGSGTHTVYIYNNLVAGNYVTLLQTNCDPVIDGSHSVTSVINGYTFTITLDEAITTAGTSGQARLDYYETLQMSGGEEPKTRLLELATKLDSDPGLRQAVYLEGIQTESGTITSIAATNPAQITTSGPHNLVDGRIVSITGTDSTPEIDNIFAVTIINASVFSVDASVISTGTTGSFSTQNSNIEDIQACFNYLVDTLNDDSGPTFNNYVNITYATNFEVLITNINKNTNIVQVTPAINLLVGPIVGYEAIETEIIYTPETMEDPLNFKHIREATIMFLNKAFTRATAYYSTDLLPEFKEVPFEGDGNGIFGSNTFGSGYFGGGSHGAPFRTYLPRQAQRNRYIIVRFKHRIAREIFGITGVTLTGQTGLSSRAYRG